MILFIQNNCASGSVLCDIAYVTSIHHGLGSTSARPSVGSSGVFGWATVTHHLIGQRANLLTFFSPQPCQVWLGMSCIKSRMCRRVVLKQLDHVDLVPTCRGRNTRMAQWLDYRRTSFALDQSIGTSLFLAEANRDLKEGKLIGMHLNVT